MNLTSNELQEDILGVFVDHFESIRAPCAQLHILIAEDHGHVVGRKNVHDVETIIILNIGTDLVARKIFDDTVWNQPCLRDVVIPNTRDAQLWDIHGNPGGLDD